MPQLDSFFNQEHEGGRARARASAMPGWRIQVRKLYQGRLEQPSWMIAVNEAAGMLCLLVLRKSMISRKGAV